MSFKRQLAERYSSTALTLERELRGRFLLIGTHAWLIRKGPKQPVPEIVRANAAAIKADLMAADLIRRAQSTSRAHLAAIR